MNGNIRITDGRMTIADFLGMIVFLTLAAAALYFFAAITPPQLSGEGDWSVSESASADAGASAMRESGAAILFYGKGR